MIREDQDRLNLLIVEESPNDAEALANILKQGGKLVRHRYCEDIDGLRQAIEQGLPDLVLLSEDIEGMEIHRVVQALRDAGVTVPVIVVGVDNDEKRVIAAMKAGAADLVSFDLPEHLMLVVEREQRFVRMARAYRHLEESHKETERRCHSLLDSSRDAIAYVHDGMHIYANRSYLEMFGFEDTEEIEGQPIMDLVADEDMPRLKEFLRTYARSPAENGEPATLEVKCVSATRGTFQAVMEFTPASIEGEPCTQIVIRDRAVDPDLAEKVKYLSKQDMLTGLFNRQYFIEELELAVESARTGESDGMLFFLLPDNFRTVRETVGIGGSDLVLRELAELLRREAGEQAVISRFGDTTFTILVRGMGIEEAEALGERLREAIAGHLFEIEGRGVSLTASIGITPVNEHVKDAQDAVSRADLACDIASQNGGDRIHLHNPKTDAELGKERDDEWKRLVESALEHDLFRLYYQPIVSLLGDTREQYEVLLRLVRDDGEEVSPNSFFPVAENHGLLPAIDRWVMDHALASLAEHRGSGHDTRLFIKVSGTTLDDEEFLPWAVECLKRHQVNPQAVVFEIAEKEAGAHLKGAKRFLKAMNELHVGTALEHFGGSPQSFQLLKHLPVEFLKIDGSYIHNLMQNEDNQAMVKSICEMARSMQKKVIAEFVQDAGSLTVLFQYGVEYIQGYFLQEPHEAMDYDFSEESV